MACPAGDGHDLQGLQQQPPPQVHAPCGSRDAARRTKVATYHCSDSSSIQTSPCMQSVQEVCSRHAACMLGQECTGPTDRMHTRTGLTCLAALSLCVPVSGPQGSFQASRVLQGHGQRVLELPLLLFQSCPMLPQAAALRLPKHPQSLIEGRRLGAEGADTAERLQLPSEHPARHNSAGREGLSILAPADSQCYYASVLWHGLL